MNDTASLQVFEREVALPDGYIHEQTQRLIGFGERYGSLRRDLQMLLARDQIEQWSRAHYQRVVPLVRVAQDRYPLVIFHGDVGTGKTATAEAMADALARDLRREGVLFSLSTRVRGSGMVGQMSQLIHDAFEVVVKEAGKARLSFIIIDEADSLAASRNGDQSHHEDKVAVNTLIQRIDDIRRWNGRVLVFLCTNRFTALDPAIVRRAGRIERFDRPDDAQRQALLQLECEGLGLSEAAIREVVTLTGSQGASRPLGFTFSDMRTRLLPEALARAFPDRRIAAEDLIGAARDLEPSPSFAGVEGA
jgi:SpoVK/Ycf46/Vps4 family AAA+-type ATPase